MPDANISILSDFDKSVRLLTSTAFAIHDKLHGRAGAAQLFMSWISKFNNAYTKVGSPEPFHSMFVRFYRANSKVIASPIFVTDEEGDLGVSDRWLRSEAHLSGPGFDAGKSKGKSKSTDSWSTMNSRCRGHVIYYNDDDKKTMAVSVPISEIYRAAIRLSKEKEGKDSTCDAYPAIVLLAIYRIFYHCIPDFIDGKKVLEANIRVLAEHVEQSTPTDADAADGSSAGPLGGIGKIMAQVMKATGMGGNIDVSNIDTMIGNAVNEKSMGQLGKVVGKVVEAVTNATSKSSADGTGGGIAAVLTGLGDALKSSDVQECIKEAAQFTSASVAGLSASIPTDTSAGHTTGLQLPLETCDPGSQE